MNPMPHFSGEISLGNIVTVISFLLAAFAAWRDMGWRVKNLEEWKLTHEGIGLQTRAALVEAQTSTRELRRIAEGQDRRLTMLENRV